MHTKLNSPSQLLARYHCILYGLWVLTCSGCSQNENPFSGGLFGWSSSNLEKRIEAKQKELRSLEATLEESRERSSSLEEALEKSQRELNELTHRSRMLREGVRGGRPMGGVFAKEAASKRSAYRAALVGATLGGIIGSLNTAPQGILTDHGKIISPYAKDKPPLTIPKVLEDGHLMKCPYTKKYFRVPSRERRIQEGASLAPSFPATGEKRDGAITHSKDENAPAKKSSAAGGVRVSSEPPQTPSRN
ncbi:MAG: hypothetical protein R3F13_08965 [Prosthecobacter sp.]